MKTEITKMNTEITLDHKNVYANGKRVGHYWSSSESSSEKPRIRIINDEDEMIFIEPGEVDHDDTLSVIDFVHGFFEFDLHEILNAIQELKISVPTK